MEPDPCGLGTRLMVALVSHSHAQKCLQINSKLLHYLSIYNFRATKTSFTISFAGKLFSIVSYTVKAEQDSIAVESNKHGDYKLHNA